MNEELRNTNYERPLPATYRGRRVTSDQRRAFTLIELVVAIGLLSIILVFSDIIFKISIGSYHKASFMNVKDGH